MLYLAAVALKRCADDDADDDGDNDSASIFSPRSLDSNALTLFDYPAA